MHIVERLCGIFVYYLLLFIVVIKIKNNKNDDEYKKLRKILVRYNIILSILAFFYIPGKTADLTRHFIEMDNLSKLNFNQLIEFSKTTYVPIYYILLYMISKSKIYHLLPAIASFIFYNCVFCIILKFSKKKSLCNKSIYYSLVFFMSTGKFVEVISGIRCLVSLALVCLCIYNELVEKKSLIKNLFIYLIAIMLHPMAVALTIFRFIYTFSEKENSSLKKVIKLIIISIIFIIIFIKYNGFISNVLIKAEGYLKYNVYSYIWEHLISIIFLLFSTYSVLKFRRFLKNDQNLRDFFKFYTICNIILFITSIEYSMFSRFQATSSILFIPILSIIIDNAEKEKKIYRNYSLAYFLFTLLLIIISATRGNLCGFRFF